MINTLRDSYSVWWADLRIMRHLWQRFLITSVMSPLLYLLAFGYGLGRNMNVEGVSYLSFVIPGIIALTAMTTSFNGAGMKLNVDRLFYKCFDEILMSPVSSISLIIGKSLIGVLRGLIVSLVFLAIGMALSPMNVGVLFFLTLLVTCFTFAFMGVMAALLAKSHQDFATFSTLVLLPMTFLGGTFFSVSHLPGPLSVFMNIIPLTHSSQCLRAVALGHPFPWLSLLVIAAFGAAFFLACLVKVRKLSI
ncbi:MAG: ABC transporter permease [Dehalococcoidia bacterium]